MAKIEGIDNIEFTEAEVTTLTVSGNLNFSELVFDSSTVGVIRANSLDGSDTGKLQLTAGGLPASDRSARIDLFANEFTTPSDRGNIRLKTGSDAAVASGSGNSIIFETGDAGSLLQRWSIGSNGHFVPGNNNAYDIGNSLNPIRRAYVSQLKNTEAGTDMFIQNESQDQNIRFYTNNAGSLTEKWRIEPNGTLRPPTNNSTDLGSSSDTLANVYTYDLIMPGTAGGWIADIGTGSTTWFVQADKTSNTDFSFLNQFAGASARIRVIGDSGAAIQVNGQTMTVPFTGCHRYEKGSSNPQEGDAVKLVNRKLEICDSQNDKACIGIISSEVITTASGSSDPENPAIRVTTDSFGTSFIHEEGGPHSLYCVASVGDAKTDFLSGAKLCDENGDIEDGDLLCTSSGYPGHLKKQEDDIVRAHTVAQARESINFSGTSTVSGAYVYLLK